MKFILTKELGRLVKWLRIFGFDALYYKEDNPSAVIIQALRDERIILTRNHRLPVRKGVKLQLVKAEKIKEQVAEVLKELRISPNSDMMFTRCIICNVELKDIAKENVKDNVPEYVFNTQNDFVSCPECKRIYWQGTHWGNVLSTLREIGVELAS